MNLTEINSIEDMKALYENMEFQWIKGDDIGSAERYKNVVSSDTECFIEFISGKRINSNLMEEYMIYYPAPPKLNLPVSAEYVEIPKQSTVTSIVYSDENGRNEADESPIYKLLKKQKKNAVEVSIKLKLNLPSKELYDVLSTSFDDAEKEIIDFVLSGIDIDDIKSSLADSIKKTYYISEKKEVVKTTRQQANKK